jgi:hypothetical protein
VGIGFAVPRLIPPFLLLLDGRDRCAISASIRPEGQSPYWAVLFTNLAERCHVLDTSASRTRRLPRTAGMRRCAPTSSRRARALNVPEPPLFLALTAPEPAGAEPA